MPVPFVNVVNVARRGARRVDVTMMMLLLLVVVIVQSMMMVMVVVMIVMMMMPGVGVIGGVGRVVLMVRVQRHAGG